MSLTTEQKRFTLLGHPKGLFVLFLTEMWERFSFYGMRALLVLFLIDNVRGGLGWSEADALKLYGIYTMAVYMLGIPGGALADRYIGQRAAVFLGGLLQCIGHFLLALQNELIFIAGLCCITIGTGLLKPNISAMVGGLYAKGDPRRDGGFTIFYIGINIGAFLASIIVGWVGEVYGWHYGFSLAGFCMLIGIVTFLIGKKHLGSVGIKPQRAKKIGSATLAHITFTKKEKDRLLVLVISLLAVCTFFAAFEQAGGLMSLYTKKYTNRYIFNWELPTSIFQGLNPAFVMIFGPIVALIWSKLDKRYKQISSIYKMGVGNIIISLGFLVMVGASLQKQNSFTGQSDLHWLVNAYLLHTLGELCLSPVSLSFITKVAPQRIKSSMMGIYFAAIGAASWIAGKLGEQSVLLGDLIVFKRIFVFTATLGLLFILFNKKLKKLTHGSEEVDEDIDQ